MGPAAAGLESLLLRQLDFLWAFAALPVNAESWLVVETVDSAFRETVVNTRGSLAKESLRKVLRSPYSDI